MTLIILLLVSTLAAVAPAAVKRDDYSSSPSAGSSGTASQPVYSPQSSPSSYTSSAAGAASAVPAQSFPAQQAAAYSPGVDHQASASSQTYSGHQATNGGNLYYYYYPVQDKAKDAGGYQASASNQYTSSVTPGADGAQSGHLDSSSNPSGSASNPSDLSYSAQDLTYSAQALSPGLSDYQGSAQASANYDQALSSLASQLTQQYGYGSANQQSQQVPQQQQYSSSSGFTYDPSVQQGSQEHAGQFSASNPVPNYGVSPNQATFIPANQGAAHGIGGFNPAAQAAAAYAQYQGQIPFGNFAAGSVPQPSSYEPAASGYRRYGIGSFIMPMLALAGLSLLIPTVTSLTASGRKKRSTEESAKDSALGKYLERMEYYYSLYKTAVEKEECMNRIICELGDTMSNARGKNPLLSDVSFKVLERVVPTWMGNSVGVFKSAALSGENEKCKKYTCNHK